MFTIATAFAAFERALIRERVKAGMARAKQQGKRLGRPRVQVGDRWAEVRQQVLAGELSHRAAAATLGIGRATVGRLISQLRAGA